MVTQNHTVISQKPYTNEFGCSEGMEPFLKAYHKVVFIKAEHFFADNLCVTISTRNVTYFCQHFHKCIHRQNLYFPDMLDYNIMAWAEGKRHALVLK